MSEHKDAVQSISEGDKFHFYDPSIEEWIETEIEELDEYRSSYKTDSVKFPDQDVDRKTLRGSMPKSTFKSQIRSDDKKMHMGSVQECDLSHE